MKNDQPLTEGRLRGGTGLVKKLGQSVAPSAPPPAPKAKDVRKGVVKMQEHEDRFDAEMGL